MNNYSIRMYNYMAFVEVSVYHTGIIRNSSLLMMRDFIIERLDVHKIKDNFLIQIAQLIPSLNMYSARLRGKLNQKC